MPLDNKISNILGVQLPKWIYNQLQTRSQRNSEDFRSNDNLLYITNKTAWIRLVSSVDIIDERDQNYFKGLGVNIADKTSLAKEFVLFGGTSKYMNPTGKKASYELRTGLAGAYSPLGTSEVQKYGYRPMPGITSVNIDTQGRLGSIRQATINFKCWDKSQLDIIDALYFKLGYSMFLEWGHTYYYPSQNPIGNLQTVDPSKIRTTELYSIDPFEGGLTKEEILKRIANNSRQTEGNYDAMLGMVTNFNFTYNQEGGYDCTLKMMGLGVLGDSIKINNPSNLVDILEEQIKQYDNILEEINRVKNGLDQNPTSLAQTPLTRDQIFKNLVQKNERRDTGLFGLTSDEKDPAQNLYINANQQGQFLYIKKINKFLPLNVTDLPAQILFDKDFVNRLISDKDTKLDHNLYSLTRDWDENYGKKEFKRTNKDLGFELKTQYNLKTKKLKEDFRFIIWRQRSDISPTNTISEEIKNSIKKQITDQGLRPSREGFTFIQSRRPVNERSDLLQNEGIGPPLARAFNIDYPDGFLLNTKAFKKIGEIIKNTITSDKLFDIIYIQSDPYQARNSTGTIAAINKYTFTIKVDLPIILPSRITVSGIQNSEYKKVEDKYFFADTEYIIEAYIQFEDTALIKDISVLNFTQPEIPDENKKVKQEEQAPPQDPDSAAVESPLKSLSNLELLLRTIQVHSLVNAIKTSNKDLEIGREVKPIEFWKNPEFLKSIFTNSVFSSFIKDLVDETIPDQNYDTLTSSNTLDVLKIQSKYGFATSLMANKETLYEMTEAPEYLGDVNATGKINVRNFNPVNFKSLLTSYVVPYQIDQQLEQGTILNHPVYIPFGQLLMFLNGNCTVYDSSAKVSRPLVYIDFNPNHNFCLSNPQQLSTDPFKVLIPFEGVDSDFSSIINPSVLTSDGTAVKAIPGSADYLLFQPRSGDLGNSDALSRSIPAFKYSGQTQFNPYRAKIMNVLLNIDYLMQVIKQYSTKDSENKVYLKPMIEQILSDVNKSLGNFNVFRLSYNDAGNVFQITDDQVIPVAERETQLGTKSLDTTLPLLGKQSIAKTLEIKSEISTKLANMIAISANSNPSQQAQLSTDGTPFGFINYSLEDRYIPSRSAIVGNNNTDAEKKSAIQFNNAIKSFYGTISPAEDQVGFATNYFIERMANIKGNDVASRASSMIPVSVNFTTDGISGLGMGQAFTIPHELLPYTYSDRPGIDRPGIDRYRDINKVGFVVVGLNHTIDNNSWNTAVRANMIFLKDPSIDFKPANQESYSENRFVGEVPSTSDIVGVSGNPNAANEESGFEERLKQVAKSINANAKDLKRVMIAESKLDPKAVNPLSGASGLIQFMPSTARGLGTTVESIRKMSAVEQLSLVEKYYLQFGKTSEKDIYSLYAYTFLPAIAKKLNQPEFVLEFGRLSAEIISKNNPAIARAARKKPGDPLTVGDFKIYVDSIA